MRQLVTIRTVNSLTPIKDADRIELAQVDGWQCIVKKGDFQVGDRGIFFEIDSVLPEDDKRFSFLAARKFHIKTMRMKKVLSQGLLMPTSILTDDEAEQLMLSPEQDIANLLRVQKYEPPVPIQGEQKGTFPTYLVPKTDQERIQNIPEVLEGRQATEFEITEKLDGTSCTFFYHHDKSVLVPQDGAQIRGDRKVIHIGACSRNWEMKLDDDNVYARLFKELDLERKLRKFNRNIAIQGEIIGGRVQGNIYKRGKQEFYVFDIYDIDRQRYLSPLERFGLAVDILGLLHVPHPSHQANFPLTLDAVLSYAEDKSVLFDTQREGVVFKEKDGPLTFKAISNQFLLKHE